MAQKLTALCFGVFIAVVVISSVTAKVKCPECTFWSGPKKVKDALKTPMSSQGKTNDPKCKNNVGAVKKCDATGRTPACVKKVTSMTLDGESEKVETIKQSCEDLVAFKERRNLDSLQLNNCIDVTDQNQVEDLAYVKAHVLPAVTVTAATTQICAANTTSSNNAGTPSSSNDDTPSSSNDDTPSSSNDDTPSPGLMLVPFVILIFL